MVLYCCVGVGVSSCSSRVRPQHTIEFAPAQTAIHFTLKTSLHTVHGTFQLKSAKVSFDPATGKLAGLLVVDAASGESGNNGRDSKMHKDILEIQKYPEITFVPFELQGDLQTQGDSQIQVRATCTFEIPYISWGLKNPSTFILRASDRVQLNVHAAGEWMHDPAN